MDKRCIIRHDYVLGKWTKHSRKNKMRKDLLQMNLIQIINLIFINSYFETIEIISKILLATSNK